MSETSALLQTCVQTHVQTVEARAIYGQVQHKGSVRSTATSDTVLGRCGCRCVDCTRVDGLGGRVMSIHVLVHYPQSTEMSKRHGLYMGMYKFLWTCLC